MSSLHSDSTGQFIAAAASSKGFSNKPYKSNGIMASSFYDVALKSGKEFGPNASFKIRQTNKFRPNISEMKAAAGQVAQSEDLIQSERISRKKHIGTALQEG